MTKEKEEWPEGKLFLKGQLQITDVCHHLPSVMVAEFPEQAREGERKAFFGTMPSGLAGLAEVRQVCSTSI